MKRYLVLIMLCFVLIIGCSSEEKIIDEMKPEQNSELPYNLFAYFEEFPGEGEVSKDPNFQKQIQIYNSMNKVIPIEKINNFSVQNSKSNHIKVFNIEDFPTFIILDKTGVVLQTNDIGEVKEFLSN